MVGKPHLNKGRKNIRTLVSKLPKQVVTFEEEVVKMVVTISVTARDNFYMVAKELDRSPSNLINHIGRRGDLRAYLRGDLRDLRKVLTKQGIEFTNKGDLDED